MPRSDKSKYTDKQKRQAEHIEAGYRRWGMSEEEAERRAWATVNKIYGGGKKPGGSGYGKPVNQAPTRVVTMAPPRRAVLPLSGLLQRRRPPKPVSRRGV
jgi:plasmid stabilization system protein ParE